MWNARWAWIAVVCAVLFGLPAALDGTSSVSDSLLMSPVVAVGIYYGICYFRNGAAKDWRKGRRALLAQEAAARNRATAERAREDALLAAAKVVRVERKRESDLAVAEALLGINPAAAVRRRQALSRDVKLAVFERDSGRCVECGSNFDIQYDHIIPFSLGGSTSVENLQILCAPCNQRKGASLG